MTVAIRPEEPSDRAASLAVERAAFASDDEAAIVEAIRDEPGSFALVAVDGGTVVGHVQLSRARIGATEVLALGPIAVDPARQREGVGGDLVRGAIAAARERGEAAVILLGDPAWYPRFGFRPGAELGLRNPYAGIEPGGFEIREEDFMLVVLDAGVRLAGPVRWHPAFGEPRA